MVIDLREVLGDDDEKTVRGVVRSSQDSDEKDVKLDPQYEIEKATGTGTFEIVRVERYVGDDGGLMAREYTFREQICTPAYVPRLDVVGTAED